MVSSDDCFLEFYQSWLKQAAPEHLVAGGVRPGMFIKLEIGRQLEKDNFAPTQFDRLHQYFLGQGFNQRYYQETSHLKAYGSDEKKLELLVTYYPQNTSIIVGSENSKDQDQEIAQGLSEVLQDFIQYIRSEKINATIKPDHDLYEVKIRFSKN